MMDYLGALIIIFLVIVALHLLTEIKINYKNIKEEKRNAYLDVLQVMTKDELYQKFDEQKDHTAICQWITVYLTMKGYKNIINAANDGDNSIDLTAIDPFGQKTYILCKLGNPQYWNKKINLSLLKELVGTMVAYSAKYGLVITMAELDEKALEYIVKIKENGYHLKYIDGNTILKDLASFRPKELKRIIHSI
ncbi:MAG: restriction endonuclease [Peptococcaceae bacterium]|nr:restriction endonuclease [Peptococcaceae bacterium]